MINTHMSKFRKIVVIMAVLMGVVSASAALPFDKYSINRKDLPDAAKEMLDEYFPKAKVSMIKVDKHLLKKTDYDVKLTNGTKIEFSNKGKWASVDSTIPWGFQTVRISNMTVSAFFNAN